MILKRIPVGAYDSHGNARVMGVLRPGFEFEKYADTTEPVVMTDEMKDFWGTQSKKLHADRLAYLLVNILGAGEYWGSNLNGDFFPEDVLRQYHKTFMQAYPFVHHQNAKPEKDAIGIRCLFSTYNTMPYAKRVEVIVALDKEDPRAQEMALQKLEKGIMPAVSMGCKVPYDTCSVCGNRAFTRKDYCEHLRMHMNGLWEGRIRVMAINDHPAFFDISFVDIPADPSSGTLMKLASPGVISSAELAEREGLTWEVKTAKEAVATIEKTGPDDETKSTAVVGPNEAELIVEKLSNNCSLMDEGAALDEIDQPMDEDLLEALSRFDLEDVLGTAGACRIAIKPSEATYLIIRKEAGLRPATMAYRSDTAFSKTAMMVPDKVWLPLHFNPEVADILIKRAYWRSFYPKWVVSRLDHPVSRPMEKIASVEPSGDYVKSAALYDMYRRTFTREDPRILFYVMRKHAGLQKLAGYVASGDRGIDYQSMAPVFLNSMSRLRGAYR